MLIGGIEPQEPKGPKNNLQNSTILVFPSGTLLTWYCIREFRRKSIWSLLGQFSSLFWNLERNSLGNEGIHSEIYLIQIYRSTKFSFKINLRTNQLSQYKDGQKKNGSQSDIFQGYLTILKLMFFVLGENCKLKNEFRLTIDKQNQNELIDKFIKYDD